jgi:4-aminobutyrate--pyruvate transaminase
VEIVADKKTKVPYDAKHGVAAYCVARCAANGLIVRNIGDTVAFCPPLIIAEDQVHELFDKFAKSMNETLDWVRKG